MIPQYLYHGTSAHRLPSILRDGLRGRKPGQKASHPKVPSAPGRVYLSETFALWYALETNGDAALLKVDTTRLSALHWLPDEDWIATDKSGVTGFNAIRTQTMLDHNKRVLAARDYAAKFPEFAEASLLEHGTIAYAQPIPPEAIVGAVKIERAQKAKIVLGGYDPCLGVTSHKILRARYQAFHAWAFGELAPGQIIEDGLSPTRLPDFTPRQFRTRGQLAASEQMD